MADAGALIDAGAAAIAGAVRGGEVSAGAIATTALERIAARDAALNSFTAVTAERAGVDAARVDAMLGRGEDPGPLAGVPFAVKNLFDIAGEVTLAGSIIRRDDAPAAADATAVARLAAAGAVLAGALNMSKFAYGYTNENHHYGAVHNPHDTTRTAGGSSGGSGAAVAGGLVALTLGSDTNGSIRLPAALCGVFGLKPTYGALSRAGTVLFAASFDHIGPLARSVADVALAFDTMCGPDPRDPVCRGGPAEPVAPTLDRGIDGLRIAVADDYFARNLTEDAAATVETVATALGATARVTVPEAHRARGAAFTITHCEGASQHIDELRSRPQDFDPTTRAPFLAGALLPAQ